MMKYYLVVVLFLISSELWMKYHAFHYDRISFQDESLQELYRVAARYKQSGKFSFALKHLQLAYDRSVLSHIPIIQQFHLKVSLISLQLQSSNSISSDQIADWITECEGIYESISATNTLPDPPIRRLAADILFTLGVCSWKLRLYEEAIVYLNDSLDHMDDRLSDNPQVYSGSSRLVSALFYLGSCYFHLEDYSNAIRYYSQMLTFAKLQFERHYALLSLKTRDSDVLEFNLDAHDSSSSLWVELVQISSKSTELLLAEEFYQDYERLMIVNYHLGQCYEKLLVIEETMRLWRAAYFYGKRLQHLTSSESDDTDDTTLKGNVGSVPNGWPFIETVGLLVKIVDLKRTLGDWEGLEALEFFVSQQYDDLLQQHQSHHNNPTQTRRRFLSKENPLFLELIPSSSYKSSYKEFDWSFLFLDYLNDEIRSDPSNNEVLASPPPLSDDIEMRVGYFFSKPHLISNLHFNRPKIASRLLLEYYCFYVIDKEDEEHERSEDSFYFPQLELCDYTIEIPVISSLKQRAQVIASNTIDILVILESNTGRGLESEAFDDHQTFNLLLMMPAPIVIDSNSELITAFLCDEMKVDSEENINRCTRISRYQLHDQAVNAGLQTARDQPQSSKMIYFALSKTDVTASQLPLRLTESTKLLLWNQSIEHRGRPNLCISTRSPQDVDPVFVHLVSNLIHEIKEVKWLKILILHNLPSSWKRSLLAEFAYYGVSNRRIRFIEMEEAEEEESWKKELSECHLSLRSLLFQPVEARSLTPLNTSFTPPLEIRLRAYGQNPTIWSSDAIEELLTVDSLKEYQDIGAIVKDRDRLSRFTLSKNITQSNDVQSYTPLSERIWNWSYYVFQLLFERYYVKDSSTKHWVVVNSSIPI